MGAAVSVAPSSIVSIFESDRVFLSMSARCSAPTDSDLCVSDAAAAAEAALFFLLLLLVVSTALKRKSHDVVGERPGHAVK